MFVYLFYVVPFIYHIGFKEKGKLKKVAHPLGTIDSWGILHIYIEKEI